MMVACELPILSTATLLTHDPTTPRSASACPAHDDIEILHTREPEQPYDELAIVKVTGNVRSDDGALLEAVREKAAEFCADAVTSISYGSEERSSCRGILCGGDDDDFSAGVVRGVAIRYRPAPVPTRAPGAWATCRSNEPCAWED